MQWLYRSHANATFEYFAGEIGILRRRTHWHPVSPLEDGLGDLLLGLERLRIWQARLAEKITPASAAECERAHTPGENMETPLPDARSLRAPIPRGFSHRRAPNRASHEGSAQPRP
jgi:hypothetical protein